MAKSEKLTESEARILAFRLSNPRSTRAEVSEALGISERQIARLQNSEPLKSRLERCHEEAIGAAKRRLQELTLSAAEALGEIAGNTKAKGADRVRAAFAILTLFDGVKVPTSEASDPRAKRPGLLMIAPCFTCKHAAHENECTVDECECATARSERTLEEG